MASSLAFPRIVNDTFIDPLLREYLKALDSKFTMTTSNFLRSKYAIPSLKLHSNE